MGRSDKEEVCGLRIETVQRTRVFGSKTHQRPESNHIYQQMSIDVKQGTRQSLLKYLMETRRCQGRIQRQFDYTGTQRTKKLKEKLPLG